MKAEQLYLKPDEGKFLSMAVLRMIEDLQESQKDVQLNWNPEARKYLKEMVEAGTSLKIKLIKLGFDMSELPPYMNGDEDEFLTKQS